MSNHCSPKIVLSLRPQDKIPDFITHVLELKNKKITYQGPKEQYIPMTSHSTNIPVKPQMKKSKPITIGKPLISMEHLNCVYWGRKVLSDINWTIREGERWALTGSNGSGKTTLLAYVVGDHPKLFASNIKFFGKSIGPGTGISIFDIQENMGHCVSL